MLVFHLPISRFLSYGITPRPIVGPWARVTERCSLLAGHREITSGGEASTERGRSGASQFRIVEPQCRPALQIRRPATFIIPIGAAIPPSCPSPRPQSPHLTQKFVGLCRSAGFTATGLTAVAMWIEEDRRIYRREVCKAIHTGPSQKCTRRTR